MKRYKVRAYLIHDFTSVTMEVDSEGGWVKYEDLQDLLKVLSAQVKESQNLLSWGGVSGVAKHLDNIEALLLGAV